MAACEAELKLLGQRYSDIYFDETPFTDISVDDDTYLIIGRRGSGKTALAQYFSFQTHKPNPICIEVGRPEVYQHLLSEISRRVTHSRVIAVGHLRRVWEYIIWSLIADSLNKLQRSDDDSHTEDVLSSRSSESVAALIEHLIGFFSDSPEHSIGPALERVIVRSNLEQVKTQALTTARSRPIFVAFDTLEQYDVHDEVLMHALAALIEYAAEFNLTFAAKGIHLKIFIGGEVFPHLKEAVLLNPLKAVRNPVYLLWRPRDLLRLIGWRFHRYLVSQGATRTLPSNIDWEDDDAVLEQVWIPHFGPSLMNSRGTLEQTWPYILRHTQMRPRQLILICNFIANHAIREGTFPTFTNEQIVRGTREAERELASEILNSFSAVYPGVDKIVSALMHLPMVFDGSELDRRAKQSASYWQGEYSPAAFRSLVAELGIVGRVTRGDLTSEFIDADFEYSLTDRLFLNHRDRCVVHPMFYHKLNTVFEGNARVLPFSTRR